MSQKLRSAFSLQLRFLKIRFRYITEIPMYCMKTFKLRWHVGERRKFPGFARLLYFWFCRIPHYFVTYFKYLDNEGVYV